MTTGYPRFFVQEPIKALADLIVQRHGAANDAAILFPYPKAAVRFQNFVRKYGSIKDGATTRLLEFVVTPEMANHAVTRVLQLSAVLYPSSSCAKLAKAFWQHTGEGISSRRAEYCRKLFEAGTLRLKCEKNDLERQCKGPKRYRRQASSETNGVENSISREAHVNGINGSSEHSDQARFVEERYGRNLNLEQADQAKLAIRRRIAGSLTANVDLPQALEEPMDASIQRNRSALSVQDVFLYPGGMNSIYNTHRVLLSAFKSSDPTICYGFPYIDTLKVLEKFGPSGCLFYGRGDSEDLDDLERRLQVGERFLALFCEFPSNPLLRTPDIYRIRRLADTYNFLIVVDETIGNFLNVHVLPHADILVSSLTKIFSGDSNVMGGAAILNPSSRHYHTLKKAWEAEYEDNYWPEDAIFLERNSRDFVSRIARINDNAEAIVARLRAHPRVKDVFYPSISDTKANYDLCKTPSGGYGGLLSVTFSSTEDAAAFYDALDLAKGPSLGTNFTLASPFVLLAHYGELEWAESLGVPVALVRFSVGLEDQERLLRTMDVALQALEGKYHEKN